LKYFVKVWLGGLGIALLSTVPSLVSLADEHTPEAERLEVAFYLLRPDQRRCAFPLCGGYWIEAVNRGLTQCADGDRREACYVAEVDWKTIGVDGSEGATLVQGRQQQKEFTGLGALLVLVPEKAFKPATDITAKGRWYGLSHNGVVCITHPCFAIDERVLNGPEEQVISSVNFDGVGAAPNDMEAARGSLARGELIAVGENVAVPDQGPAGAGIVMVASQFFLRIGSEGK
jgi:hypothetical protein